MDDELPPYPEYKASGVPWLDSVPNEWQVLRAKYLFRIVDIRSTTGEEELLTVSSKDGVVPRSQKTVTMFKAESYIGHKLCWPGDLVINSLWAWMQGLGFSRYFGLVSSAYSVYRVLAQFSGYLHYFDYLLRSAVYKWELLVRSKGVWLSRLQLTDSSFFDMPLLVPPEAEVELIVRYLDHIDRRVRRYIRAQQRLLALLHEQKQAIIHQAVTRGLDASAPLKPSGVVWLGEVPAHWEVWQVAHFAKVGNGSTPSRSNPGYWSRGEYPWLNSASVNHGRITASDQYVTDLALKECHLPIVNPGSILIAITGQGKTRGTAALLEMEATINQHIAFITPRSSRVLPDYLLLFLRAAYADLRRISDDAGGTKGALTCEDIKHYKILVPPLGEQRSLVETVRHQTERIDFVMHRTQREIDLIREYRTRLIADVVTGKVDVRAVAAALPVEAVEDTVWAEGEGEHEGEEVGEEELQRMQTGNG